MPDDPVATAATCDPDYLPDDSECAGNLLLCLLTGHVEVENVNVRSKWDTHCAWCQKGMAER